MSVRRAVPIEAVAAYVVEEMKQAEAAYERGRAEYSPVPGARERADWCRYVHRELCKTEEHGVGAVLGVDLGEAMLEQLALLGEQLYWQEQIGTVPQTLTELAVSPFRKSTPGPGPGQISADFGAWCREKREQERAELNRLAQPGNEAERREVARRRLECFRGFRWEPGQSVRGRGNQSAPPQTEEPAVIDEAIEFELRLRDVIQKLGGFRPLPGLDEVHRQAERAAGHIANWRILQKYEETNERDLRNELEIAREAAHAAVEAARAAQPDTDTTGIEAIARDIEEWIRTRTRTR